MHCTLAAGSFASTCFPWEYWNVLLSLSYFEVYVGQPSLGAQTLFLCFLNNLLRGFCICLLILSFPSQSCHSFLHSSLVLLETLYFLQSGTSFSLEKKCLSLWSHFKRPGPIFPLFIEPGPASFYLGLDYEKICTVHRLNCVLTSYPRPDVYVEAFTPQCHSV